MKITTRKTLLSVALLAVTGAAFAQQSPGQLPQEQPPCAGAGGTCFGNWLWYGTDTSHFVTTFTTENADGSGGQAQTFEYLGEGGNWRLKSIGEAFEYAYETGFDQYGYPIVEWQRAYAQGNALEADINMQAVTNNAAATGGGRITNLADGVNAMDAVNKRQLDAAVASGGGNDPLAVKYTDANRNHVTVGGRVSNVANGVEGGDAVNVNQMNGVLGVAQDGVNRAVNAQARADLGVQNAANAHARADVGVQNAANAQARADLGVQNAATAQNTANVARQETADLGAVALRYVDANRNHVQVGGRVSGVANGVQAGDAVNLGQLNTVQGIAQDGVNRAVTAQSRADLGVANAATAQTRADLGVQNAATAQARADQVGADLTALDQRAVQFVGPGGSIDGRGARLSSLADGIADTDAANMRQLRTVAGDVGALNELAVQYADTSRAEIVLGGEGGTRIGNLSAGIEAGDAVNLGQLNTVQGIAQDGVNRAVTAQSRADLGVANAATAQTAAETAQARADLGVENAATAQASADQVGIDLAALDERAVQFVGPEGAIDGRGARLVRLADGIEDTDAANMGQLRSIGDELGELSGLAVQYTDTSRSEIVLGGEGGTRISNLADGVDAGDAVNRGQLDVVSADLAALDERAVQFVGPDGAIDGRGARLANLGDGIEDTDAANMRQLRNLAGDVGELSGLAVQYTDETHARIMLATGGTRISNVLGGFEAGDAVNFGQLGSVSAVFGGGSGWNGSTFTGPTYTIGGTAFGDIGSTFAAVDARLGMLTGRVDRIENGTVWYDTPAQDTVTVEAPKGSVTLEGEGGTRISNVADGVAPADAANVRQVQAAQAEAREYTDTRTVETRAYTDERMTTAVREANAYTDSVFANQIAPAIDGLRSDMNIRFGEVGRRIDRQAAISAATSQMAAQAANVRSERGRLAAGIGYSGGEQALSIGYGRAMGDRGTVSAGFTFSGGESSAGVGFGFDL